MQKKLTRRIYLLNFYFTCCSDIQLFTLKDNNRGTNKNN